MRLSLRSFKGLTRGSIAYCDDSSIPAALKEDSSEPNALLQAVLIKYTTFYYIKRTLHLLIQS